MSLQRVETLWQEQSSYWAQRVLAQWRYAHELGYVENDARIGEALTASLAILEEGMAADGVISDSTAQRAENVLANISPLAKGYRLDCVSHAHIDMNWMWGYHETVAITLETLRTVLNLMRDYETFTFSQSQASVYRIVQEHDPDMLDEIRTRVKEGRWEVTASTWVETDKNMPSGESLARHILYSKRYLSGLLDIAPDQLALDFEPDTFGHSRNVPEILNKGGVRWYYHCRGYDDHTIYRWQAPSGASVLVYREPLWYNSSIAWDMGCYVPAFCSSNGIRRMLKVYGVGDHGGGPTRRDLERILDMAAWPVYPTIGFGTYGSYFTYLEDTGTQFPVVDSELNAVFTGCYTSQSRIKAGNAAVQVSLHDAEVYQVMAALQTAKTSKGSAQFHRPWQNLLFNHFHDILPGSGTAETREHAMGLYQEALAVTQTEILRSLRAAAAQGHVDPPRESMMNSTAEGAGVGYGAAGCGVSQTARGAGATRYFAVFNSTEYARQEPVEVIVWDWPFANDEVSFTLADGTAVRHHVVDSGTHQYWGHTFVKVLVEAEVPATGFAILVLQRLERARQPLPQPRDPRVATPRQLQLENQYLRAVFTEQGALVSLRDKDTGQELVDPQAAGAVFRFVLEDDAEGMTAWRVGSYKRVEELAAGGRLVDAVTGDLRQALTFTWDVGAASTVTAAVSLLEHSRCLQYEVTADWYEQGRPGVGIPQLQYHCPLAYRADQYAYDVPFGVAKRQPLNMDVPANSWAWARRSDGAKDSSIIMWGRGKHGFRGTSAGLTLTLLRSSYDPDPAPEFGKHTLAFAVGALPESAPFQRVIRWAKNLSVPMTPLSVAGWGDTTSQRACIIHDVQGPLAVSAVKLPENAGDAAVILRAYETEGTGGKAAIKLAVPLKEAQFVDLNEEPLAAPPDLTIAADGLLQFSCKPHEVISIRIVGK